MKILLVLPAGEKVRVTREHPEVPRRRKMLRFSVLPLTLLAALTPPEHEARIVDENVEPLNFDADADVVGVTFMTALAPRADPRPPVSPCPGTPKPLYSKRSPSEGGCRAIATDKYTSRRKI